MLIFHSFKASGSTFSRLHHRLILFSESTEYWCGQNLIDGAVTAIQTQILVGAALSDPKEQAALKVNSKITIVLLKK